VSWFYTIPNTDAGTEMEEPPEITATASVVKIVVFMVGFKRGVSDIEIVLFKYFLVESL
jgi:hypothetical protein